LAASGVEPKVAEFPKADILLRAYFGNFLGFPFG
jgi:hypothetical protein